MSILKANRIENLTTTDGGINVNNSGNVGIGLTTPSTLLHLKSTAFPQLTLERDGSGTQGAGMSLLDGSGDENRIFTTDSSIVFDTGASSTPLARFQSGGGISFGNDTAAANALSDYEEGTFTVGFTQSGATITANSSYNTMNYTKIGRICHIFGHIRVSTVSGSGSGNIKVTGLPFQVKSGASLGRAGLHVTYLDLSATSSESLKSAPFQFDEGTTNLELETSRFTSIPGYGNGDELMISATYLVN